MMIPNPHHAAHMSFVNSKGLNALPKRKKKKNINVPETKGHTPLAAFPRSVLDTKKFRSRLLENLQLSAWYQHFSNDEVVMRMNKFFLKTTFMLQTGRKLKI